ncbi:MAG: hypothetical protein KDA96_28305, partial [Planctomycetaceae bacterium]|nr:hypothetical protein [Planctomycetaceae bacterium]
MHTATATFRSALDVPEIQLYHRPPLTAGHRVLLHQFRSIGSVAPANSPTLDLNIYKTAMIR